MLALADVVVEALVVPAVVIPVPLAGDRVGEEQHHRRAARRLNAALLPAAGAAVHLAARQLLARPKSRSMWANAT